MIAIISLIIPILGSIAFLTLGERKIMGSMQRRVGPNKVGIYGLLQPLADGLKLFLKETIFGSQIDKGGLFILAPVISFSFSMFGWLVIPFDTGVTLGDLNLGILYLLAISSVGVLGIILAGWSANSKYPLLGSLRTTAQMISYEVVLGLIVGIVIFISNTFNITSLIEIQKYGIWNIIPLLPVALLFLIGALAETNRAPMDLPESESELVAGYMTEHSSFIFALFFLAEYGSIILISTLLIILFFGGYLNPFESIKINYNLTVYQFFTDSAYKVNYGLIHNSFINGLILGFKVSIILIIFIWIRASYPRLRYDQLMSLCWTSILPLVLALFILVSSLLLSAL